MAGQSPHAIESELERNPIGGAISRLIYVKGTYLEISTLFRRSVSTTAYGMLS